MRDIICFGAGDMGAEAYDGFLKALGYNIKFWADNDKKKWNTDFLESYIINPEKIKSVDCPVFISCIHKAEITEQLIDQGIDKERIWNLNAVIDNSNRREIAANTDHNTRIAFDICNTSLWAGTELWCLRLANELSKKSFNVVLFLKEDMPDTYYEDSLEVIKLGKGNESNEMYSYLTNKQSVVLINSFSKIGMLEAAYIKRKSKGNIKVISVLHNEDIRYLRRHADFIEYTDAVYAVSRKIQDKARKYFEGKEIKYYTQCVPVDSSFKTENIHSDDIRIAFASRIEKHQKRADLLPVFIEALETKHISYILNIAGTGGYEAQLHEWVEENGFGNHVRFWGFISPDKMKGFWLENDVYLSLSDFEGFSLSMLEGMSYGLIPIVSNVSGVDEVVRNGENGFIFRNSDVGEYANAVERLSKNPELLFNMRAIARNTIIEKCDYGLFVEYFIGIIEEINK